VLTRHACPLIRLTDTSSPATTTPSLTLPSLVGRYFRFTCVERSSLSTEQSPPYRPVDTLSSRPLVYPPQHSYYNYAAESAPSAVRTDELSAISVSTNCEEGAHKGLSTAAIASRYPRPRPALTDRQLHCQSMAAPASAAITVKTNHRITRQSKALPDVRPRILYTIARGSDSSSQSSQHRDSTLYAPTLHVLNE